MNNNASHKNAHSFVLFLLQELLVVDSQDLLANIPLDHFASTGANVLLLFES